MKKFFTTLSLLLCVALVAGTGCVEYTEEDDPGTSNGTTSNGTTSNGTTSTSNGTTSTSNGTVTAPSTLELTYISGHFGNYWDCPDEAYDPDAMEGASSEARPDGDSLVAGDCADDSNCGGISNCESAQVTVRLANTGDETVTGIQIAELLLLDSELMERASLPIISVNAIGDAAFTGSLEAGGMVDLRIDFRGPLNLYALLESGDGGTSDPDGDSDFRVGGGASLRVIFKADEQEPATLDTPEIYGQPSVDT